MGALSDIVSISITTQSAVAKQLGFGIPLIVGCSSRFPEVIRSYNDTDGMVADGFSTADPEFMAASALCAQDPRPPTFKVGRRALPATPVCTVTPAVVNSKTFQLILDGTAAAYTSDATATAVEICTGLKSALDALAPTTWIRKTTYAVGAKAKFSGRKYVCITAGTSEDAASPSGIVAAPKGSDITDGSAHWQFTGCVPTITDNGGTTGKILATAANAGDWFSLAIDDDPATIGYTGLALEWTHADAGITTDLNAIKAADADFYGLMLCDAGTAEVKAAATWAESNKRLLVQATSETAVITAALSGATDVAASLKTSNDFRTGVIYHAIPNEFADAAWLGARLWTDAGGEDWKFCQLAGISTDRLSATHIANLKAKNANGFADYGGLAVTFEGTTAAGEFIDVIRGRDWLESNIQALVYTALVNASRNGKTPFTDSGIGVIEGQIRAALQQGEDRRFLAKGSSTVTAPRASAVSAADKAARKLTGVVFSATLAGAVHAVDIKGTVTV